MGLPGVPWDDDMGVMAAITDSMLGGVAVMWRRKRKAREC
jgi:hypothetical protein